MRILENPTHLAPIGGVELSSLQVAEELAARGHEMQVLYQTAGVDLRKWEALASAIRQVPSFACTKETFFTDVRRLAPAVRAARTMNPDLIYLNRAEQIVWGALAAKVSRVPLVVHLRTHLPFPGVKVVGRAADKYIAVSRFVADHWIDAGIPADRMNVVHNGIDPSVYPFGGLPERTRARAELGLPQEGFVVLYYGRVASGKGVSTLLEAWRILGLAPDKARLLLVGGSPDAQASEYERDLRRHAPAGTEWRPMTANVMPALHAADLVVLPAEWQEPFGRVVIEGMSSGRPVVSTYAGGIPEILTGEFSSMLVPPKDAPALAAKLDGLQHWRTDNPRLGERCARHVVDHFSLRKTVDAIEGVLREAAGESAQLWPETILRAAS